MRSSWAFVLVCALALLGAGVLMWPALSRSRRLVTEPAAWASAAPVVRTDPGASASPAASASAGSLPAAASPAAAASFCAADMVPVDGRYCPFVAHRCAEEVGAAERGPRPPRQQRRCRRYRDELICEGRPVQLHFCIDRLEYPNLPGAKPVVLVDYRQAVAACRAEGKRLCEAEEWVFACEGKRTLPYPYGIERDPGACNIDRRRRMSSKPAFTDPYDTAMQVERLDQRTVAGGLPDCVSPFGAHDMSGNVAEWVHFREGRRGRVPSDTGLAGGHWDRVAASCRLLDLEHAADHRDHRTGFRCCADATDRVPARRLMPKEARLPHRRRMLASSPLP